MPGARDFLERLRLSAAPGAASPAGVPVDRVAELSAELQPVLALLEETQDRAASIRSLAESEAARRQAAGAERATAILAEARLGAEGERRETAARVRAAADEAAAQIMETGRREAQAVSARAEDRLPDLVRRALEAADAELKRLVEAGPA